jgi:hypothetical protein
MRLLIVVSVTLLSACATNTSLQALESANKSFEEHASALGISYEPIEHSGPSTAASDEVANARGAAAWPVCEAEMLDKTRQILRDANQEKMDYKNIASFIESIVNVSPYQKSGGTYVQPHVRTAPNSTCLDNLRGCR